MLTTAATTYLAVRRASGFALRNQGFQLKSFAAFSEARGHRYICAAVAIEWAGLSRSVMQRARRLGTVIRFARYLRAEDACHEVPPAIFGTEKAPRPTPYILTTEDIRRLVTAAAQSMSRALCGATYSTLLALLASTGLRVSEAIRLRYDDITPDGLVIQRTKFRKSRLVPMHETARAGLERYLHQRRPYAPFDDHVFVSVLRKPLRVADVDRAFTLGCETEPDDLPHTRCVTRSRRGPCAPAQTAGTPSPDTCSRCRPTSVIARWPIRIGICKPCRI